MDKDTLQISQFVTKHPILAENEEYKRKYLKALEYFVIKYSADDIWSTSMLKLYKNKLLTNPSEAIFADGDLKNITKGVISWKIRKFKFFSYRYCLLIDVLFICSFKDKKKSGDIYNELKTIYNKRYWKKLDDLFLLIIEEQDTDGQWDQTDYIRECLILNRKFLAMERRNILVTANMSAGKSTLLNALIGKKVNKTQNDVCTAKIHYLLNKAFEDDLTYEYDYVLELDASMNVLMEDNEDNQADEIIVGTHFRSVEKNVCFIDTPGVNSSLDSVHKEMSHNAITSLKFDILLYLLNGENIGTEDDRKHLEYVAEKYKGRIVFVVNKLDRYNTKEDSIQGTLEQVKKDLLGLGFIDPVVCPISAYAAYLAKMRMYGEELNNDELDELEWFYRKLKKEEFHFNNYYPGNVKNVDVTEDENQQLLLHSGILSLEKILYEER